MRIAICSVGELFGGVERHILGAIDALHARDIQPLLLLFQDGELAAQARILGCEPKVLPWSNAHLIQGARMLADALRADGTEIIHVHGYKATVFAVLARRWHRCAMVKTEHGLPELSAGNLLGSLRTRSYHAAETLAVRWAGAQICYVTQELADHHALSHTGLSRTVIPNAVPNLEPADYLRPPEFSPEHFNLVLVGRLTTVKGMHFAIHALAEQNVASHTHLFILGDGPLRQELQILTDSLGLTERVHFLGFRREVFAYLAHADALLMPSLHEGLPYTLLEAMSFARPIIASEVGGLAETLKHDKTALLFPTGNVPALAQSIASLVNDPSLATRLGNAARQEQRQRYSLDAMCDSYMRVYQQAIANLQASARRSAVP